MSEKKHPSEETNRATSAVNSQVMPALGIDWDFYMRLLEDSDAPDEQKRELIETVWSIIVAFVDLGFGVHPIQQACDAACGQNEIFAQISAQDLSGMVDSTHSRKSEFGQSADPTKEPQKAGSKT
jgi:hypothetical protein